MSSLEIATVLAPFSVAFVGLLIGFTWDHVRHVKTTTQPRR